MVATCGTGNVARYHIPILVCQNVVDSHAMPASKLGMAVPPPCQGKRVLVVGPKASVNCALDRHVEVTCYDGRKIRITNPPANILRFKLAAMRVLSQCVQAQQAMSRDRQLLQAPAQECSDGRSRFVLCQAAAGLRHHRNIAPTIDAIGRELVHRHDRIPAAIAVPAHASNAIRFLGLFPTSLDQLPATQ